MGFESEIVREEEESMEAMEGEGEDDDEEGCGAPPVRGDGDKFEGRESEAAKDHGDEECRCAEGSDHATETEETPGDGLMGVFLICIHKIIRR